jgi:hypothetical protein
MTTRRTERRANSARLRTCVNNVVNHSQGWIVFAKDLRPGFYWAEMTDDYRIYFRVSFNVDNPGDVSGYVACHHVGFHVDFKTQRWTNRMLANYQILQKLKS